VKDNVMYFGTFNGRGNMAASSGTIEVTTKWHKIFSLLQRRSIGGKKIRGKMYCEHTQAMDCGRTMNFYKYATEKELFELKLKGLA